MKYRASACAGYARVGESGAFVAVKTVEFRCLKLRRQDNLGGSAQKNAQINSTVQPSEQVFVSTISRASKPRACPTGSTPCPARYSSPSGVNFIINALSPPTLRRPPRFLPPSVAVAFFAVG